jgi:hypothetical protein
MAREPAPNPSDGVGVTKALVSNLFYGWGYHSYRLEKEWRADDLLIRGKLSDLLRQCRAHLAAIEAAYRREHLPSPTPELPFPAAMAVTRVQALQRVQRDVEHLETSFRTAPIPDLERIHRRHRDAHDIFNTLADIDSRLVQAIMRLHDAIVTLGDRPCTATEVAHRLETSEIGALWRHREQTLSALLA